jgi:hypothetical protein
VDESLRPFLGRYYNLLKGVPMTTKRPSFLKRQKEQKRHARAAAKRDARREKNEARKSGILTAEVEQVPSEQPSEQPS